MTRRTFLQGAACALAGGLTLSGSRTEAAIVPAFLRPIYLRAVKWLKSRGYRIIDVYTFEEVCWIVVKRGQETRYCKVTKRGFGLQ